MLTPLTDKFNLRIVVVSRLWVMPLHDLVGLLCFVPMTKSQPKKKKAPGLNPSASVCQTVEISSPTADATTVAPPAAAMIAIATVAVTTVIIAAIIAAMIVAAAIITTTIVCLLDDTGLLDFERMNRAGQLRSIRAGD